MRDRERKILLRSRGESGMAVGLVPSRCLETQCFSKGMDWMLVGPREVLAHLVPPDSSSQ